jgi:hypothetical protein
VDRDAYAGAAQWIEQMTGASGRTGYNYPGGAGARPEGRQETFPVDSVEPMTAAAIWCRQLLGGDALGSPLHRKAIGIVLARPPSTRANERDQIYWHFGALALFHDSDGIYRKWEKALEPALSVMRDRESGAWNALGVWARDLDDKDRVYPTATAVLTLLTPTRYPRDFLTKPKLSAADRAAIAALKKALRDEDARVQEIAAAALARLP